MQLTAKSVQAVKYDIASLGLDPDEFQQPTQWDARPLTNGAPAHVAAVHRDLRARRHGANLIKRKTRGLRYQPLDRQLPVAEAVRNHRLEAAVVIGPRRAETAVDRKGCHLIQAVLGDQRTIAKRQAQGSSAQSVPETQQR